MKRSQRTVHASIWPVLALIMAATIIIAVIARDHAAPVLVAPAQETH
jgi:hypothetical protein